MLERQFGFGEYHINELRKLKDAAWHEKNKKKNKKEKSDKEKEERDALWTESEREKFDAEREYVKQKT